MFQSILNRFYLINRFRTDKRRRRNHPERGQYSKPSELQQQHAGQRLFPLQAFISCSGDVLFSLIHCQLKYIEKSISED